MTVGLVGNGPARAAVEAALADVDVSVADRDVDDIEGDRLAIVVDQAGASSFRRADDVATPWLAVELGGLGGYPVVDAAVSGFGPETACYSCLRDRVEANVDPDAEPVPAPPAHTARLAGAIAGREAVRILAEGATDPFGRVRELPDATRRFLPVPGCSCGEPLAPAVPTDVSDRDLEAALTRAELGLDDRVGIVQEVGEAESFPVPYYLATLCDTAGFSDVSAARNAAGVAVGWDAAFMKALGEAYERYCAGVYRTDGMPRATPAAQPNAVPPDAFVTPEGGDVDGEIAWAVGGNLLTGSEVALPAELVYYPPPQESLRPAITTGLGLGNSGTEAILAGLYEVIERDATMLAWYSSYEPLGLAVDAEPVTTLRDRARSEDLDVTLTLLTQDVDVPVVAAAVAREEWPRLALGSGASLSVTEAAASALAEALQNWVELQGMGPDAAREQSGHIGRYADDPDAVGDLRSPETTVPASAAGPADPPTGEAELTAVLERLATADLTPYAVRTTTRDVAQLGFEAVRALVPGAQPLFFGDPYFGERAETVPEGLGFEPRLDREHHPFP